MKTSLRFCQKLEGNLAVAVTKATFTLMKETFSDVCEGESYFYSGYTHREGEWRDVNTAELLTWDNWSEGTVFSTTIGRATTRLDSDW